MRHHEAKPASRPPAHLRVALVLVLACAFALFERIRGVDFLLPQRPVGDEEVFLRHLQIFRGELVVPREDYRQGIYPQLVPRLANFVEPRAVEDTQPADLATELERAKSEHVLLRKTVVWLSLIAIPATWLMARTLVAESLALFAAALCAASSFFLWFAAQARPHGASAALATLALAACLCIVTRGGTLAYLCAGTCVGLATGALHSGVVLLLPLGVAHLMRSRRRAWRESWKLALALVPVAIAMRVFYPYLFWNSAGGVLGLVRDDSTLIDAHGFTRMLEGLWDFEPWIVLILAFALWRAWTERDRLRAFLEDRTRRAVVLVIVAYAVPYFALFGMYIHTTQRYALPLVPILCIVAAWAAGEAGNLLARRRAWLCTLPALVLFVLQAASADHVAALRGRADTIEESAAWIGEHLDPAHESLWTMPGLDPPLWRSPELTRALDPEKTTPWLAWQIRHPTLPLGASAWMLRMITLQPEERLARLQQDPAAFIAELGPGTALVELYDRPLARELIAGVRARGERIARFSPYGADDAEDTPFLWRDAHGEYARSFCWLWHAWKAERLGSVVELYRLR